MAGDPANGRTNQSRNPVSFNEFRHLDTDFPWYDIKKQKLIKWDYLTQCTALRLYSVHRSVANFLTSMQ